MEIDVVEHRACVVRLLPEVARDPELPLDSDRGALHEPLHELGTDRPLLMSLGPGLAVPAAQQHAWLDGSFFAAQATRAYRMRIERSDSRVANVSVSLVK